MPVATAERERTAIEAVPKKLYIGGKWIDGSEGTLPVEDPSTGETIAEVPDAGPDDALAALASAAEQQAEWAARAPRERSEILRRAYELMVERSEDLALVMTLEMGKAISESE